VAAPASEIGAHSQMICCSLDGREITAVLSALYGLYCERERGMAGARNRIGLETRSMTSE
jgi:hypothetical protein